MARASEPTRPTTDRDDTKLGVRTRTFAALLTVTLGAGAVIGYGVNRTAPTDVEPDEDLARRGLAWALELQEGPLEGLARHQGTFLIIYAMVKDPVLNVGMERIVNAILEDDPLFAHCRRRLASSLAIEFEANATASPLIHYVPYLRRVR